MRQIWRYDITPGINVLWLTPGAQVLKVAKELSKNAVSLWALVDPKSIFKEERVFLITPSGVDLPDESADTSAWKFVDTFFIDGECPVHKNPQQLVFHMFEQLKIAPALQKRLSMRHVGES
jgi:hypothetical protein